MNKLFTARTTNGSSSTVPSNGRTLTVVASGTWDSATLTVEVSPDSGTTWVPTDTSFTASGVKTCIFDEGVLYRLTVASAGAGTSLNAWVNLR
jgi:hypothetical protein